MRYFTGETVENDHAKEDSHDFLRSSPLPVLSSPSPKDIRVEILQKVFLRNFFQKTQRLVSSPYRSSDAPQTFSEIVPHTSYEETHSTKYSLFLFCCCKGVSHLSTRL